MTNYIAPKYKIGQIVVVCFDHDVIPHEHKIGKIVSVTDYGTPEQMDYGYGIEGYSGYYHESNIVKLSKKHNR